MKNILSSDASDKKGMHYARITEDMELANTLFAMANNSEKKDSLTEEIEKEAYSDNGEFYRKIIAEDESEQAPIREFFLRMDLSEYPSRVQIMLAETLLQKCIVLYERYKSEECLKQLSVSYYFMALKNGWEQRPEFLRKSIETALKLHEMQNSEQSRAWLGRCYFEMGSFETGISYEERLEYHEKMIDCGVNRVRSHLTSIGLGGMAVSYMKLARDYGWSKKDPWAWEQECRCYKKALACVEKMEESRRKNEQYINIAMRMRERLLAHGGEEKTLDILSKGSGWAETI